MQKLWFVFISLILLPLAGCSNSVVSDVTRFHNLPAPNGETIEVISLNPELQNSLEFGQYAEIVGQHLGRAGYNPPQGANSRLIAKIAYFSRVAEGATNSGPRSSVGIGVGGGNRHSSVGVGISLPLGKSEPRQYYIQTFILEIFRRSDGTKLYEGQVSRRGKEPLPLMMPYLVQALFQDFPGQSGTSNRVKNSN